eukprot:NODE_643_length_5630_cov_0.163623.p5 type:complete len:103 gc:universal NODE_643_length_5630_cov_0.163623:866-558(-)
MTHVYRLTVYFAYHRTSNWINKISNTALRPGQFNITKSTKTVPLHLARITMDFVYSYARIQCGHKVCLLYGRWQYRNYFSIKLYIFAKFSDANDDFSFSAIF